MIWPIGGCAVFYLCKRRFAPFLAEKDHYELGFPPKYLIKLVLAVASGKNLLLFGIKECSVPILKTIVKLKCQAFVKRVERKSHAIFEVVRSGHVTLRWHYFMPADDSGIAAPGRRRRGAGRPAAVACPSPPPPPTPAPARGALSEDRRRPPL